MYRNRRVGTLSAGIALIVFGLLFIGRQILPAIDYALILSLWPLVLIFIGIEIIISWIVNKEEKMRYDAGAIVMIFILAIFAMGMGCIEFAIEHFNELRILLHI